MFYYTSLVWLVFPLVVVRYLEDGSADNDQFVAITSETFTEESARVLFAGVIKLLRCASRQVSLKPEVIRFTGLCVLYIVPNRFLDPIVFTT